MKNYKYKKKIFDYNKKKIRFKNNLKKYGGYDYLNFDYNDENMNLNKIKKNIKYLEDILKDMKAGKDNLKKELEEKLNDPEVPEKQYSHAAEEGTNDKDKNKEESYVSSILMVIIIFSIIIGLYYKYYNNDNYYYYY